MNDQANWNQRMYEAAYGGNIDIKSTINKSQMAHKFQLFDHEYGPIIDVLMTMGPYWQNFNTRTSKRKFIQWTYPIGLSEDYSFLKPIIDKILESARYSVKEQIFEPLQMFVCYYHDGTDSCPGHKHGCRQLTVSFGASRVFKINSRSITLENGEAIILYKQRHSVPKSDTSTGPRISFNLFFTTLQELPEATIS